MALRFLVYIALVALGLGYDVHVAPMVSYTTRHFRFFMRLLSSDAVLWSEMIKPGDLLSSQRQASILRRGAERAGREVVQFGGDSVSELELCCRLARDYAYNEINLNCGCPSIETNAHFGANLMREPEAVSRLLDRMAHSVNGEVPISVKCRIGTHHTYKDISEDRYEVLHHFVSEVTRSGAVQRVAIHARSAVLQGLCPDKNRCVPPIRYDFVHAIARDFPDLEIILNGGVTAINRTMTMDNLKGVMVGRQFLRRPLDLLLVDASGDRSEEEVAMSAILSYARYASSELRSPGAVPTEVVQPFALLLNSLLSDAESSSRDTPGSLRLLKLLLEAMIPVLAQLSASAVSSLIAVERLLELCCDGDKDSIIDAGAKIHKILKSILGKKLSSKIKSNCAEI